MGLQPRIAKRSARVESLDQMGEVGQPLVERSYRCHFRIEELAPVWTCLEWNERALELDEHVVNHLSLGFPGEVDADTVFPVVHAHPEPIRGHRANLGHLQNRSDPVCEAAYSFYGFHGVSARQQVLRLQL